MVQSRPPAAFSDSDSDSLPTLATLLSRPVIRKKVENVTISSMKTSAPVGHLSEKAGRAEKEGRLTFNMDSSSVNQKDGTLSRQTTVPPTTNIILPASSSRIILNPTTPPPAPIRPATADHSTGPSDSAKRHQILADLLFPPSPPPPLAPTSTPTVPLAQTPRAKALVDQLWAHSREEDDDDEELKEIISDSEIERERDVEMKERARRREVMSSRARDGEMEEVQEALGMLRIQGVLEGITPSKSGALTSSKRGKFNAPPPNNIQVSSSTTLKTKTPAINWIVLSDSSDEEQESIPAPKHRNVSPKATPVRRREKENVESGSDVQSQSEFDPYAGLLTYEPTPRSFKPARLIFASDTTPRSSLKTPTARGGQSTTPLAAEGRGISTKGSSLANTYSDDDWLVNDGEGEEEGSEESGSDGECEILPARRRPLIGITPSSHTTTTPRIGQQLLFPPTPSTKTSSASTSPSYLPSILAATPTHSKSKSKSLPTPSKTKPSNLLTPSERQTLPLLLIQELDRTVFRRKWEGMKLREGEREGGGLPADIEVVWNKRLRNTAGRANWKKSTQSSLVGGDIVETHHHKTSIDLSIKVLDTAEKLKQTLAHELCHVATWTLSGDTKSPHGTAFKLWGARVSKIRPDIKVTTTHSYEIVFKYRWKCLNESCGKIFQRHSNSIVTDTHGCPCGSSLAPVDQDGNFKAIRVPAKKSAWQDFLTTVGPTIRADNPGINQGEVAKRAAVLWKEEKERKSLLELGVEVADDLVDSLYSLQI